MNQTTCALNVLAAGRSENIIHIDHGIIIYIYINAGKVALLFTLICSHLFTDSATIWYLVLARVYTYMCQTFHVILLTVKHRQKHHMTERLDLFEPLLRFHEY